MDGTHTLAMTKDAKVVSNDERKRVNTFWSEGLINQKHGSFLKKKFPVFKKKRKLLNLKNSIKMTRT